MDEQIGSGRYKLFLDVGAGLYGGNYNEMKDDLADFLLCSYKRIGRRKIEMIEDDIRLVDNIIKNKADFEGRI